MDKTYKFDDVLAWMETCLDSISDELEKRTNLQFFGTGCSKTVFQSNLFDHGDNFRVRLTALPVKNENDMNDVDLNRVTNIYAEYIVGHYTGSIHITPAGWGYEGPFHFCIIALANFLDKRNEIFDEIDKYIEMRKKELENKFPELNKEISIIKNHAIQVW